ncbi:hypothetical protein TNCV_1028621 [Trichonephila clavipes]|nr:hypothetical protein TNCV_1028621 [Trichonephila clavipes]
MLIPRLRTIEVTLTTTASLLICHPKVLSVKITSLSPPLGENPSQRTCKYPTVCLCTLTVYLYVVYYPLFDEAHFWLNGYVNKQNCRIWSEANPQVYVETQLHPEKLTVWCVLWAGGILLKKR